MANARLETHRGCCTFACNEMTMTALHTVYLPACVPADVLPFYICCSQPEDDCLSVTADP